MNILYLSNARMPTEKAHGLQIMKTCEALSRAGHAIELVVPRRNNSLENDAFSYYGITTKFPMHRLFTLDLIRFGRIGFLVQELTFALAVALAVSPSKYDAIYSRDEVLLCVLSLFGFRPFVWESHDGAWNVCARSVVRRARAVVVVSGGLRDWYVEKGVPREKISVIPNAIDPEAFAHPEDKDTARRRLGLPLDAKIILYIGRLDGWKGTDTLLEASRFFDSDTRLAVIGGDEGQLAGLRKQNERVIFLGSRPYSELPDNQAAADVLVVPNTGKSEISTRFTSPLKLIAHMASERPIVASDLPSIREITGDDAALLVPADDPKALAVGIRKVLANQDIGGGLARRAREVVARYSWSARAEAISKLFQRV